MENKQNDNNQPRRTLIDVYRDELSRHCAQQKEILTLHYRQQARALDDVAKAHEEGLVLSADAKLAQIEAVSGCCPRCGHCKDASTAAEEGDDHGPL